MVLTRLHALAPSAALLIALLLCVSVAAAGVPNRPHRFSALWVNPSHAAASPQPEEGFEPIPGSYERTAAPMHRSAASALVIPEDAAWEGWIAPGILNPTPRMVEYHSKLVLAAPAAGHAGGGLVTWDGVQFSSMPAPPIGISTLTVWNDQLVVAAGSAPHRVYAFDGAAWNLLGEANNFINVMGVHAGTLILGGRFTSVNGVPVKGVASFDGVGWGDLGSVSFTGATEVLDVTEHAGSLVIGGSFSALNHIAIYDDLSSTWHTPGAGFNLSVYALASDGVKLYAAGSFTSSGATAMQGRAEWNGSTWSVIPGTTAGSNSDLVVWNGGLVLKGGAPSPSRLTFWNGSTLTAMNDSLGVGGATSGSVFRLLNWGGKLVANGNFLTIGVKPAQGVAVFDGTSWSTPTEPWTPDMLSPEGRLTDLTTWNSKLIAVGSYGNVANGDHWTPAIGISAWDGASWSPLAGGVFAVQRWLGSYQGDLIVTGWGAQALDAGNATVKNVLRWNGTSWSGFGTPPLDFGISSHEYHGDLYVAHEDFVVPDGIRRWNGSVWSTPGGGVLYTPFSQGYGDGLAVYGDSLVLSGLFDTAGGTPVQNVAFWDGTTWHPADTGLDGFVYTVTTWNGRLIAGGEFTHSGTRPMTGAAIWDGTAWQPLGTNAVEILRFAVSGDMLFASGDFRLPDNSVIQTVARWDGSDWHILGSGTNSYGIAVHGGYLYNAGTGIIHGHFAHGLSRIPLAATLDAPSPRPITYRMQLSAAPNPVRHSTSVRFSLAAAAHARVSIVDIAGREISELADHEFSAGAHDVDWSADHVAPGIYFARLTTPRESRVVRLAVIGR